MKKIREILAADLFCGAGGTSQGLLMAANGLHANLKLIAINHWQVAIDTHRLNHPEAENLCTGVDVVDPLKIVPGGRLDLLCASPECTHHSVARGGRPMNDQSRASAWHIARWAQVLYIKALIIENVPEFVSWGPLGADGRPMKSRRGALFNQFIDTLKALGYKVEWRILNCADYGAPTTRRRLFILARRDGRKIVWPAATHVRPRNGKQTALFSDLRPLWKTARQIIDWSIPSKDIFDRKKPLADNTLRRIQAGMEEFNGIKLNLKKCFDEGLRPYLVVMRGTSTTQSVDDPLRTVTGRGNNYGLVQPFLLPHRTFANMNADDLADPLRTVTAHSSDFCLIEPFTMQLDQTGGDGTLRGIDAPVGTVVTKANACLVEPFLSHFRGNHAGRQDGDARNSALDTPLPTQDTSNRFGVAEPFLIAAGGTEGQGRNPHSMKETLGTVLTNDRRALVELEPSMVTVTHSGGDRHRSVDRPMPTVTRSMGEGVTQPYMVEYYGLGGAQSVEDPLSTVTCRDRNALILPRLIAEGHQVYRLEIRFRMLQPRELARAQGFPDDYAFTGNREAVVRQIGNAVPPPIMQSLAGAVLA